jgi:hypothetical protein
VPGTDIESTVDENNTASGDTISKCIVSCFKLQLTFFLQPQ